MIAQHSIEATRRPPVTRLVTLSARRAAPPATTATATPTTFVVIASRVVSPDRLDVVLRGEHDGTLDGAKRHAQDLARLVADRCAAPAARTS